jgi:GNAT superfamily N-acetyltransferase
MDVSVREVVSRRDLKRFVMFPFSLYRGNRCWVPPLIHDEMQTLRSDKNPAFEFCEATYWLAYRGDEVVGRIAGIINRRYIELWGKRDVRFGWIDFIDDDEVSAALLGTVERWAREQGMERLHGPFGFTDLDREGMLIEGFDELGTFATIYNHPYYPGHLERHGYGKEVDWVEFEVIWKADYLARLDRLTEVVSRRYDLRVLEAKRAKDLLPYAREVFTLLNSAYRDLHAFVPLSDAQIDFYIEQFFGFVVPDFVPIVLDGDGRVAAFGIALPSLSLALQRTLGRRFPFGFITLLRALRSATVLDLYLIAVRPDLQGKGANALIMSAVAHAAGKHGIVKAETNIELESNTRVQSQWKQMEHRQHKRRRSFTKHLA